MYGCHEPYLQIFTHNLALSGSRLLCRYHTAVAATPILFNCSTWCFIMAPRARQATMHDREDDAGFSIHRRHNSWKKLKDLRRNPIKDGAISGFSGQNSVPE